MKLSTIQLIRQLEPLLKCQQLKPCVKATIKDRELNAFHSPTKAGRACQLWPVGMAPLVH